MSDASRRTTIAGGKRRADPDRAPLPDPKRLLPVAGELVGDHYRLVRTLGAGNFGQVWVAKRVDVPEHQVALKILPRSHYQGRNPERELVMLATVGHPHLVQLKDHGTTPRYVWLTMPVYEGETLAARLERETLSPEEAHAVFVPIAQALEALHAAGLRHQDVKPDNVFLARFGARVHPVLLDLGSAAERDAHFVAGTPLFASPEQLRAFDAPAAQLGLSESMDTYALAATLLEALVGSAAFPGETAKTREEMALAHARREHEPLAEGTLPTLVGAPRRALARALGTWLAVDPAKRPSMAEVVVGLDVLLEGERARAHREQEARTRQRVAVARWRAAAAGLTLVGAGALGYAYTKRETLRLASELDAAREGQAVSFDRLDTCTAAHTLASRELDGCQRARALDADDARKAAEAAEAVRHSASPEEEATRVATEWRARLRACRADAEERATAQASALSLASIDAERALAACERGATTARDEEAAASRLATERETQLADARKELDACLAKREAPAPPATPALPVAPAGSAPGAGTPEPPPAAPALPGGPAGASGPVGPEPATTAGAAPGSAPDAATRTASAGPP